MPISRHGEGVADGRVLRLLEQMLTAGYRQHGRLFPTPQGTPQGGVVATPTSLQNFDPHPNVTYLLTGHARVPTFALICALGRLPPVPAAISEATPMTPRRTDLPPILLVLPCRPAPSWFLIRPQRLIRSYPLSGSRYTLFCLATDTQVWRNPSRRTRVKADNNQALEKTVGAIALVPLRCPNGFHRRPSKPREHEDQFHHEPPADSGNQNRPTFHDIGLSLQTRALRSAAMETAQAARRPLATLA
jgi:hypothetical protein